MRARDIKIGQKVKITLSKDSREVLSRYSGRLGVVVDVLNDAWNYGVGVAVAIPGLETKYFQPRELQAR